MATKAALPGSAAAPDATPAPAAPRGTQSIAGESGPWLSPEAANNPAVRRPNVGDIVLLRASNRTVRAGIVISDVAAFDTEHATWPDPVCINLVVFANEPSDGHFWRETAIQRLNDVQGYIQGVPAWSPATDATPAPCWLWPEDVR